MMAVGYRDVLFTLFSLLVDGFILSFILNFLYSDFCLCFALPDVRFLSELVPGTRLSIFRQGP